MFRLALHLTPFSLRVIFIVQIAVNLEENRRKFSAVRAKFALYRGRVMAILRIVPWNSEERRPNRAAVVLDADLQSRFCSYKQVGKLERAKAVRGIPICLPDDGQMVMSRSRTAWADFKILGEDLGARRRIGHDEYHVFCLSSISDYCADHWNDGKYDGIPVWYQEAAICPGPVQLLGSDFQRSLAENFCCSVCFSSPFPFQA